jgi:hypothetical protein
MLGYFSDREPSPGIPTLTCYRAIQLELVRLSRRRIVNAFSAAAFSAAAVPGVTIPSVPGIAVADVAGVGGLAGVAGLASGKVDVIVNHRRIGSSHKDGSPDDKIQTAGPSLISASCFRCSRAKPRPHPPPLPLGIFAFFFPLPAVGWHAYRP